MCSSIWIGIVVPRIGDMWVGAVAAVDARGDIGDVQGDRIEGVYLI